jgi:hypothetical protein
VLLQLRFAILAGANLVHAVTHGTVEKFKLVLYLAATRSRRLSEERHRSGPGGPAIGGSMSLWVNQKFVVVDALRDGLRQLPTQPDLCGLSAIFRAKFYTERRPAGMARQG